MVRGERCTDLCRPMLLSGRLDEDASLVCVEAGEFTSGRGDDDSPWYMFGCIH